MSEETPRKKFNWNYVALGILIIGYLFSAGRFFIMSQTMGDRASDKKIIRVAHWQLEPGYREALDKAINDFNNLPHVKENDVEVVQSAITERVYSQFMNVHLISGTAPDIAVVGKSSIITGNAIARFFTPLGDYVSEPNPYNSREFTSPELDPEMRDYLATAPWKDTFLDGMEGGWNEDLNDYYSVPVSNFGKLRLFYNMDVLAKVKAFILKAVDKPQQPTWLKQVWLHEENGETAGYLPDSQSLRDWLANDHPPETLGQLMLYCTGVEAYTKAKNLEYLVPISGSNYFVSDLANFYQPAFFSSYSRKVDLDGMPSTSGLETVSGWRQGIWSFEDPALREFYEFSQDIASFFPVGYQGLDREQAQRRFVLGNAAIISSGGWDASGIFSGVAHRDNEEDRFEIEITPAPLPAEGERWADLVPYRPSEADFKAGVPMGIYKQSRHFEEALDFLKFLSSQPVNEEFNQNAQWLPATIAADPTENMVPFMPVPEGFPGSQSLNLSRMRATIRTEWVSQAKLLATHDITYDEFVASLEKVMNTPRIGALGFWFDEYESSVDRSLALHRKLAVETVNEIIDDTDEKAQARQRALFYQGLKGDEGIHILSMWKKANPGEPFPEF